MKYELYWTCKAMGTFAASLTSAVSVYIHYSTTTKATESVIYQIWLLKGVTFCLVT